MSAVGGAARVQSVRAGDVFANGDGLHAVGFDWRATLTVVRRDLTAYGTVRATVVDRYGRHGVATGGVL